MLFSLNKTFLALFFLITVVGAFVAPSGVALAQQSQNPLEHADIDTVEFSCFSGIPPLPDISCVMAWVAYSIMGIFRWFAGGAGVVMNYAVQELIVNMGVNVNQITAIDVAWSILRDIANVFLVFITLFMGIATILGITSYGYKQLFWRIIVAALLVNFSMFFTTIVIDVTNIAAINLYSSIAGTVQLPPTCTEAGAGASDPQCVNKGISGAVIDSTKLTSSFNAVGLAAGGTIGTSQNDDVHWNITIGSFMNGLLYIIVGFVFIAAAILLLTRFVILIILIVLSPVAFVAIVTRVGGRQWWSMVLNQSLFAPAFFLMLVVSTQIISTLGAMNFLGANDTTIAAAAGQVTSMSIILNFAVIMGFVIASLVVARSLGAYGSQAIIRTGQSWSRRAGMAAGATVGAATFGVGGRALRGTVGRAAYNRTRDEKLLDRASQSGWRGRIARAELGFSNKLKDSNFDARSLAGKKAQQWTGGPIDTFEGTQKRRIKQEEALQKQIGNKSVLTEDQRNELGAAEKEVRSTQQEQERWQRRVVDPQQKEVEKLENSLNNKKLDEGTRANYEAKLAKAQQDLAAAQAEADTRKQAAEAAREKVEGKRVAQVEKDKSGNVKKDDQGNVVYKKDKDGNTLYKREGGLRQETEKAAKEKAEERVRTRANNVVLDGTTAHSFQSDIETRELAQAGLKTIPDPDKDLLKKIRDDVKKADEGSSGATTSEKPAESGSSPEPKENKSAE